MRPLPEIVLRPVVPDDLPVFFAHQRDPAAVHQAAFTTADPDDEAAFRAHWARVLAHPDLTVRTVVHAGAVVGHLASFVRLGRREVGGWFDRASSGQGLATAALTAFLRDVTTRPLYARVAHDNTASIRVLERCGFRPLAVERVYARGRHAELDEVLYVRA